MVDNLAVIQTERRNPLHLIICQSEVQHVEILAHPFHMSGLWNNRNTPLYVPMQSNLRGAFAVLFANLCQKGMGENTVFPLR